jgi:RNA polymerase sigma-70 factor (ECF subfamily)
MDSAPPALDVVSLYRQHAQTVARWAARLGGPSLTADLEDVVQEVFIHVDRLLPGFRGEAAVTTWMFEITSRIVRRHRRRTQVRRWLGVALGRSQEPPPGPPTPAAELERRQALQRAYGVLDGMSEKYRRAFVLYELEGMSGQEIAELTGDRVSTVWVHVHRARKLFDEGVMRLQRVEEARAGRAGGDTPKPAGARGRAP